VTDQANVRLGINNVLDNDPSINASVGTTGNGNTYPQVYDALGRLHLRGRDREALSRDGTQSNNWSINLAAVPHGTAAFFMTEPLLSGLAASPDVCVQKIDLARGAALLVQLNEGAYRAASFLDDRILTAGLKGAWASLESVLGRLERAQAASRCISSFTPVTSARRCSVACSMRAAVCCRCASRCRCGRSPMRATFSAHRSRC
jgi:hypothetical protein